MSTDEADERALLRMCPACQAHPGDRCTQPTDTGRREVKRPHFARRKPTAPDAFGDPLRDPRFPDRPQTPDFWRLSEINLQHDGDSRSMEEIFGEAIDLPSVRYMATQRAMRMLELMSSVPAASALMQGLTSIYLDAFLTGVDFQKRGGHRPNETGTTTGEGGSL